MANFRRRSFRAAHVACAPPLARIHERLFKALGLSYYDDFYVDASGEFGKPGDGSSVHFPPGGGSYSELEIRGLKYFFSEWLSKLDDNKPSPSKAKTTWERFHTAERSCFDTNQRLKREWRNSPYKSEITLACKIASKILGQFDWDRAARGFRWGPGATTRLTRLKSDAAHKYSGTPHATIGNAILANTVLRWNHLWGRELPELDESEGVGYVKIVPGNRVVTVPKNYKTDRTIAIEPDMNIYVQLGIGALIRERLQKAGLDLNDQTRNQRLARVGALTGRLATIDLSMASDTISRAVVELMIPPEWLDALGQCRSPFGVLPSGEEIFYQKFSSMGNGYTFELETVIFWSLALAVCHLSDEEVTRVSVYGDDIILPSTAAPRLMGLLTYLGFTPNSKKSFFTGDFRESCGKHYIAEHDVTPFYVKRPPKTLLDLFKIHNQLFRYVDRAVWLNQERRRELLKVCSWLRGYAPAAWRKPSIVDGMGDGAFVGYFDEVLPQRAPEGWEGWVFKTFLALPVSDDSFEHHGLLVKSLDSLERLGSADRTLLKEGTDDRSVYPTTGTRYVAGEVYVSFAYLHRLCTGLFAP